MLRALIFDVDGTLADTERDGHRLAFNAAFRQAGLPWVWDEELYGELLRVTGGKERIHHFIEQCQLKVPVEEGSLEDFVTALHQVKTACYGQLLEEGRIQPRPGVLRLLKEARQERVRLAIATTATPENVEALLERCFAPGARQWFAVIGAGDMVAAKKPAPQIYHYVLRELTLEPNECLAFEDSCNGLRASSAAGVLTLITTNAYTVHQSFEEAVLIMDHLGEPDRPCRVHGGRCAIPIPAMVDMAMLRDLHRRCVVEGLTPIRSAPIDSPARQEQRRRTCP